MEMSAEPTKEDVNKTAAEGESNALRQRNITVAGGSIDSRDLFSGARELTITHGSDVYRLRLTSQNKLILTK